MSNAPSSVSEHVKRAAILHLFMDMGAQTGNKLAFTAMEQHWRRSGLRHADLMFGLEDLQASGLITVCELDEAVAVQLSPEALAMCTGLTEDDSRCRENVIALTTLLKLARRRRNNFPVYGRRAGDAQAKTPPRVQVPLH